MKAPTHILPKGPDRHEDDNTEQAAAATWNSSQGSQHGNAQATNVKGVRTTSENIIKVKTSLAHDSEAFSIEDVVLSGRSYSGVDLTRPTQITLGMGNGAGLVDEANRYNSTIHTAFDTPGFEEFFIEHGQSVTKQDVAERFGSDFAESLFSLTTGFGTPQFGIAGDYFVNSKPECIGSFDAEGHSYRFSVNYVPGDAHTQDGVTCFYDWSNNSAFFGHGLYYQFTDDGIIEGSGSVEGSMEFALECKGYADAFVIGEHALHLLKRHGYAREYLLIPDRFPGIWAWKNWNSEPWIRFLILDLDYKKDKLLTGKIQCLYQILETDVNGDYAENNPFVNSDNMLDLDRKSYFLEDENDKPYISLAPGTFGGHHKLKIYGRLDCPSANRYVAKGQYVKYRVFFKDEETAMKAGYRPCGVCMREKYKRWKASLQPKPAHINGDA